jgi:SAM-dependent methyltransferase
MHAGARRGSFRERPDKGAIVVTFSNVYQDPRRAAAYASLEFPGTYYLAYRDLPALYREHVRGTRALDFGCGAGRSTRFLKALGFEAIGVDISADMVKLARERDPGGDYRVIADGDFSALPAGEFDLVQSVFTFDNIPGRDRKVALFTGLRSLLAPNARLVCLVSSPDIYVNEWASFSTRAFAGNFTAKAGDFVYTEMLDVEDRRPVQDVLWPHADYLDVFSRAAAPIAWVSETRVAPWVIYVLARA